MIFIAGMIVISVFAFKRGDPIRIITPFDSVGNRCGVDGQGVEPSYAKGGVNNTDYSEHRYKLFTDVQTG